MNWLKTHILETIFGIWLLMAAGILFTHWRVFGRLLPIVSIVLILVGAIKIVDSLFKKRQ